MHPSSFPGRPLSLVPRIVKPISHIDTAACMASEAAILCRRRSTISVIIAPRLEREKALSCKIQTQARPHANRSTLYYNFVQVVNSPDSDSLTDSYFCPLLPRAIT